MPVVCSLPITHSRRLSLATRTSDRGGCGRGLDPGSAACRVAGWLVESPRVVVGRRAAPGREDADTGRDGPIRTSRAPGIVRGAGVARALVRRPGEGRARHSLALPGTPPRAARVRHGSCSFSLCSRAFRFLLVQGSSLEDCSALSGRAPARVGAQVTQLRTNSKRQTRGRRERTSATGGAAEVTNAQVPA